MIVAACGPGLVLLAWLAPLALAGCGQLLPRTGAVVSEDLSPVSYRLDPEHASLLFKLDHLGFSQLVGRFDEFDATLDFDPAQPEAARLAVLLEVASIDLDLPAFEEELRRPEWFDAARYPEARFESRGSRSPGSAQPGPGRADSALRAAPVTLEVTVNGAGDSLLTGHYTLGFAARGMLLRSEFGIGAYAPAVGDEVALEMHAERQRNEPGA